jgi:hypothetical protein
VSGELSFVKFPAAHSGRIRIDFGSHRGW